MNGLLPRVIWLLPLLASCQVKPYTPPPSKAHIETVEVEMNNFHGRPDAYAIVQGRLTSSSAQLVDPRQHREENTLYVDVLEQTPRGATLLPDMADSPGFRSRIPLDLLGLPPGDYSLSANGIVTPFTIPQFQAEAVALAEPSPARKVTTVRPVDEFVPIEDSPYASPAPSAALAPPAAPTAPSSGGNSTARSSVPSGPAVLPSVVSTSSTE